MPAPGEQYQSDKVKNPFDERVVSNYTAQNIATLQSRLNKQLGPEYLSNRKGHGGTKVWYLEGNKAIALANEVFGFNGWSSSLQQVQVDFVDESSSGRVTLGLSIIVRITLKDGTYHEDIGYGSCENLKGKATAFEKAKKEAATDGLKRALRTFGNVLGNCLYDKTYLRAMEKMKVNPPKFDESRLYRHEGYQPQSRPEASGIKVEPQHASIRPDQVSRTHSEHLNSVAGEFDDEYDGNLFDGVEITEHGGDEFTFEETAINALEASKAPNGQSAGTSGRSTPAPNSGPSRPMNTSRQSIPPTRPPPHQQQQQNQGPGRPAINPQNSRGPQAPNQQQNNGRSDLNREKGPPPPTTDIHAPAKPPNQNNVQNQNAQQPTKQPFRPTPPQAQQPQAAPQTPGPIPQQNNKPAVGFVTSRAAELMQSTEGVSNLPAFNPHAESPVPKHMRTPGFDHSRSVKVTRQEVNAPPPPAPALAAAAATSFRGPGPGPGPAPAPARTNFINPHQDPNRRIGMPGAGAMMSPSANRGAYKPPTFAGGVKRPPLQDVSNQNVAGKGGGEAAEHEAKRQKVDGGVPNGAENGADAGAVAGS
ncbi:hypothetical protein BS50DRAFT_576652 [Corynespora cassiicola Philippines]|uniref:RAD52 homolog n=1 Tax=Corynespora cassiicola Philippines TaxID=1448308 RepID=A0A2T2NG67_CORCC|nr:hypothetical protein BS50DRAFT_576652 [Corynespora cassiicola Philippines]